MSNITDNDIINKFRDTVAIRYEYNNLKAVFPELPASLDESVIGQIKHYFLESIYPPAIERKALEEAFAGLGSYVKSPKKIWGLLGNMSSAVFRFGRQFPTALKAGLAGLSAFQGAKDFEAKMVEKAMELNITVPMSDDDFDSIMAKLPKKELDNFVKDVKSLFKIMSNTKLIEKTIMILDSVRETMQKKSHIYPKNEIDGILLGRDILNKGFDLFSQYDEKTKQTMVEYIYKNEILNINTIFNKYNS